MPDPENTEQEPLNEENETSAESTSPWDDWDSEGLIDPVNMTPQDLAYGYNLVGLLTGDDIEQRNQTINDIARYAGLIGEEESLQDLLNRGGDVADESTTTSDDGEFDPQAFEQQLMDRISSQMQSELTASEERIAANNIAINVQSQYADWERSLPEEVANDAEYKAFVLDNVQAQMLDSEFDPNDLPTIVQSTAERIDKIIASRTNQQITSAAEKSRGGQPGSAGGENRPRGIEGLVAQTAQRLGLEHYDADE